MAATNTTGLLNHGLDGEEFYEPFTPTMGYIRGRDPGSILSLH